MCFFFSYRSRHAKVNGKVRAELELSNTATADDARALAQVLPNVRGRSASFASRLVLQHAKKCAVSSIFVGVPFFFFSGRTFLNTFELIFPLPSPKNTLRLSSNVVRSHGFETLLTVLRKTYEGACHGDLQLLINRARACCALPGGNDIITDDCFSTGNTAASFLPSAMRDAMHVHGCYAVCCRWPSLWMGRRSRNLFTSLDES